jgi:hypothetical protein
MMELLVMRLMEMVMIYYYDGYYDGYVDAAVFYDFDGDGYDLLL